MVSLVRMVSLVSKVSCQNGKFGQDGKVNLAIGSNGSSSDHNYGCVVNGSNTMAAI